MVPARGVALVGAAIGGPVGVVPAGFISFPISSDGGFVVPVTIGTVLAGTLAGAWFARRVVDSYPFPIGPVLGFAVALTLAASNAWLVLPLRAALFGNFEITAPYLVAIVFAVAGYAVLAVLPSLAAAVLWGVLTRAVARLVHIPGAL